MYVAWYATSRCLIQVLEVIQWSVSKSNSFGFSKSLYCTLLRTNYWTSIKATPDHCRRVGFGGELQRKVRINWEYIRRKKYFGLGCNLSLWNAWCHVDDVDRILPSLNYLYLLREETLICICFTSMVGPMMSLMGLHLTSCMPCIRIKWVFF
jgi:hypothetical protein